MSVRVAIALLVNLPYTTAFFQSTLRDRLSECASIQERVQEQDRLTKCEEEVLVRWISDQQRHLVAPNIESCPEIVTVMLITKGDFQLLGKYGLTQFLRRHSELGAVVQQLWTLITLPLSLLLLSTLFSRK
jgi:hypothetical protein